MSEFRNLRSDQIEILSLVKILYIFSELFR